MKKTFVFSLLFGVLILSLLDACKKEEKCSDTISYNNTMKSIIDAKCTSCHKDGGIGVGHGKFTSYQDMTPHFEHSYEAAIEKKEMPQAGAPQLTEDEIKQWKCWKENGFKE